MSQNKVKLVTTAEGVGLGGGVEGVNKKLDESYIWQLDKVSAFPTAVATNTILQIHTYTVNFERFVRTS